MDYSFEKLVAVSGQSNLYHMVANRGNGLILEDIGNQKRQFYSMRQHQFTPMASIGIYTDDDSIELKEVFNKMNDSEEAIPEDLSNAASLISYFEKVLPQYDRDRVKINDMKKVIKWFNFLKEKSLLELLKIDEESAKS
jgi:hypothetical protein